MLPAVWRGRYAMDAGKAVPIIDERMVFTSDNFE